MALHLLERTGGTVKAIEGALHNYLSLGRQNGYAQGYRNNFNIFSPASNAIALDTGLFYIQGFRVDNDGIHTITFTSLPSQNIAYQIVAQLDIRTNAEQSAVNIFSQPITALRQDNIFSNGSGVYELEIARFTVSSSGISNIVRTIQPFIIGEEELDELFLELARVAHLAEQASTDSKDALTHVTKNNGRILGFSSATTTAANVRTFIQNNGVRINDFITNTHASNSYAIGTAGSNVTLAPKQVGRVTALDETAGTMSVVLFGSFTSKKSVSHIIGFTDDCDTILNPTATNHHTTINNVITSVNNAGGGTILFRAGTYNAGNSILLPTGTSNISLVGEGNVIIKASATGTLNLLQLGGVKNVRIKNITIDADNRFTTCLALYSGSANINSVDMEDVRIQNCNVINGVNQPIYFVRSNSTFTNVVIENCFVKSTRTAFMTTNQTNSVNDNRPRDITIRNNIVDCGGGLFDQGSYSQLAPGTITFRDNTIINTIGSASSNVLGTTPTVIPAALIGSYRLISSETTRNYVNNIVNNVLPSALIWEFVTFGNHTTVSSNPTFITTANPAWDIANYDYKIIGSVDTQAPSSGTVTLYPSTRSGNPTSGNLRGEGLNTSSTGTVSQILSTNTYRFLSNTISANARSADIFEYFLSGKENIDGTVDAVTTIKYRSMFNNSSKIEWYIREEGTPNNHSIGLQRVTNPTAWTVQWQIYRRRKANPNTIMAGGI